MSTRVHQLFHGYRRGHERLAGSIRLPAKDAELVARLSDLSGSPSGPETFVPYLTAYPLPSSSHFAVAKTWPDLQATRAGCVLTHTLLVPMEHWRAVREPKSLAALHQKPKNGVNDYEYAEPLEWPQIASTASGKSRFVPFEAYIRFVHLYFAKGRRPIVWFDNLEAEDASWSIFRSLWPAMRARFAVCTHCLQPRTLDDRPFDLMFADAVVHPRFLKIDRENIIGSESNDASNRIDEWCKRWSERVFDQASPNVIFDQELFGDLDDDPTAIRRLYLIDSAVRSKSDAPQAAVGAMDLVESVARQANVAIRTKSEVAKRAVKIASETSSPQDSVECLRLIEDRLNRGSYSAIANDIGRLVADAVAKRTQSDPELVAKLSPGSYDVGSEDNPSWFLTGMVQGFRQLVRGDSGGLAALRSTPRVSALLFSAEPLAMPAFVKALISRRTEPDVRHSIREMLKKPSEDSELLRRALFAAFTKEDVDLLDDLLTQIKGDDVNGAMNSVAPLLTDHSVRKSIEQALTKNYSTELRHWALSVTGWSNDIAAIAASTYASSREGLLELLNEKTAESRISSMVIQYLKSLARGRFPIWLRRLAVEDMRLFAALLVVPEQNSADSDEIIFQLLRECEDLRPAHFPPLLKDISRYSGRAFYAELLELVFSDLIKGYLDATIGEEQCVLTMNSREMSNWLEAVNCSSLVSLLTYQVWNRRENWLNAWKLLLVLPSTAYLRSPSIVLNSIDSLLRAFYPSWSAVVAHTWVEILGRIRTESPASSLSLRVQAFRYAIDNSRYPLSEVVVETFKDIYHAVTGASVLPVETSPLFGMLDWDKGKELRKTLIDTFMGSHWPAGDLALASAEPRLFRKIFKRIYRKSSGPQYLSEILSDLNSRNTPEATQMANILGKLLRDPDFYEDWD